MQNGFEKWITTDEDLNTILEKIEATNLPVTEQAEMAFHQLCEVYKLPKLPENLEHFTEYYENKNIDILDVKSVYEELAFIKYLEPEDDPRGLVMFAIYNVKNNESIVSEVENKFFGNKVPKEYWLGFKGQNTKVELTVSTKELIITDFELVSVVSL